MFDRSAYAQMMDDVENGKVGIVIMEDMARWGRGYLQVENATEIFRNSNVRFIAINSSIDSAEPSTCMDMAGLDERFPSMIGEQMDIWDKLKPLERRLATLKSPSSKPTST